MLTQYIIQNALDTAFAEDWGLNGDISSQLCIPPESKITAQLRLRNPNNQVIAGLELAKAAFLYAGSGLQVKLLGRDGKNSSPVLAEISGKATELLSRERVALNYLCHLSGVATLAQQYVDAVAHTRARIVDTRKTTPGLRALEKYAIRCGGAHNHRFGLFDAIMIKDNHIVAAGGINAALQAARQNAGHMLKIELEVDTLAQLHSIDLDAAPPDCILLDNMGPDELKQAVDYIDRRAQSEASGGVTLQDVGAIAQSGVNFISVGAMTHSAPILDIGLDIV